MGATAMIRARATLLTMQRRGGVTLRCDGCDATTRELVPLSSMFADFFRLLEDARISLGDLTPALKDERKLEQTGQRIRKSPEMLRQALRGIREAQEEEAQTEKGPRTVL
jgi:hypothetical protein